MRLSPPVPGLLPREVLPGGLRIPALDLALPAGVNIGVCTYSIHHHEDYVVNPFQYNPSRWLDEDYRQDKTALQAIFNPFSLGNRACLGKPLVYMELSIAVARLVFEYDMKLSRQQYVDPKTANEIAKGERHPNEYHMEDWFLSNTYGPWVEFRRREFDEQIDSAIADME